MADSNNSDVVFGKKKETSPEKPANEKIETTVPKTNIILKPGTTFSNYKACATSSSITANTITKLSSNPFSNSSMASNENSDSTLQNNPFAERVNNTGISSAGNSDSEALTMTNSNMFQLRPSALSKQAEGIGKGIKIIEKVQNGNKENSKVTSTNMVMQDDQNEHPSFSKSSTFVFGQNLEERVTNTPTKYIEKNGAHEKSPVELTFNSSFDNNIIDNKDKLANHSAESTNGNTQEGENKTLLESANIYAAKNALPDLQEVETVTGEEDESNVLQTSAKLYLFEKSSQVWLERGRGIFRLNDVAGPMDSKRNRKVLLSRIVMRTQGSLRLILNSKIWAAMTVEKASQKSVRITAADIDEEVKVFLIVTTAKDADQIFRAIDWRIQQLKIEVQRTPSTSSGLSPCKDTPVTIKRTRNFEDDELESSTESVNGSVVGKKFKQDSYLRTEESNDSSTVDPETEGDQSSVTSSPLIKSSSSE